MNLINRIKSLKGLLYKKLIEEEELRFPKFKVEKPEVKIKLPDIRQIRKLNVIYPLIEPFAFANIKWDNSTKDLVYFIIEPNLSEKEREILEKISNGLVEIMEVGLSAFKDTSKALEHLEKNVKKIIKDFGIKLDSNQYAKIMYYIYRNFVGYDEVEPLLQDPFIEDISCDGINTPIYIVHRKYGSLRTNVIFKDERKLRDFIVKLSERCGRYVSYAEPILAGTLPDGSRVSATLAKDVTTRGPVFTIRKFTERPFSPTEQIELKTASSEILAYLWYLIENKASILVIGGTATGKTSFLNTLCTFILPEAKIVSIEDTRELKIPHEHWIPGLARVGFGTPKPTGEKYGEVSLFDLLRESFRQNPDYVIVGEVRGKETYVMFQGMSSGHPSLSTFHAGSVDSVIKRLTTPPIELSPTLLESLDAIIVMIHTKEKGKSARRIKEIVEIESVDPKTFEIKTNVVFRWDPALDRYEKINESSKIKKIALLKGADIEKELNEIKRRERFLKWLLENGIRDYDEVARFIVAYYKEPERIEEIMKEKLRVEARVKEIERKTFLEMLGYKVIREEYA